MKKQFSRYFILISIFTCLAVFIFVVQKSYDILISASMDQQDYSLIKTVSPNLNIQVLDEIEKRH